MTSGSTIVPSSECPISGYTVEDSLAVDASGIYVACSGTGGYEIRKYSLTGTLQKILGSSRKKGYGYLTRLRLTATHAYWLGEESDRVGIYRAEK